MRAVPTVDRPDDELAAVTAAIRGVIEGDRYPHAPRLEPLRAALARLDANVCCFAPASGGRWKVRVFGPALGVPEDPATGSAAGPLALHLARHGAIRFGQEIEIHQGVEILRPSVLHARVEGSAAEVELVEVGGAAVIVARGWFEL